MKLIEKPVSAFLEDLASEAPAPGGGSASALTAAAGAALVSMVGKLTVGKKKFLALGESDRTAFLDAVAPFDAIRCELAALVDADAASFDGVMAAYRLPKNSDTEIAIRKASIVAATRIAIAVPLQTAQTTSRTMALLDRVLLWANRSCLSDLGCAATLMAAGVEGAVMNVGINLSSLEDPAERETFASEAAACLTDAQAVSTRIVQAVRATF
ncbi:MAG: cyclodeaminase/cyclohydrolase family protein [bacterium]